MKPMPPSEEALKEVSDAAARALSRPGETIYAVAVFVIIDGPDLPMARAVIDPADATDAVLRIIARQINKTIDQ